jgi:hypothetical protein
MKFTEERNVTEMRYTIWLSYSWEVVNADNWDLKWDGRKHSRILKLSKATWHLQDQALNSQIQMRN